MTCGDPGNEEYSKSNVAKFAVTAIFETFSKLSYPSQSSMIEQRGFLASRYTHREDNIDHIHDNEDIITNSSVMIAVTRRDESNGDKMMTEHLPVVFASFLDIDNNDLLQPESPLAENVALHQPLHLSVWPVCP